MGRLILQGKGLVVSLNHVGLWCEPEGLSPDGSLHTPTNRKTHQAREPRGPSPSGGNSAAKSLFLEYSRAPWARCGVQGVTPCREPRGPSPSGGNFAAKPLSLEYPRALWARCGVQGVTPCREARRRAAVKPRPTSFPSGALRAYGAQSEWGSAPSPACGGGGRRRRPGESEGEGQREGRHPWSGCRPSERAGRRWRP